MWLARDACRGVVWFLVALWVGLTVAIDHSVAQVLEPGPTIVGNGFPNGAGSTLGRLFLRVSGLPGAPGEEIPLKLVLSSAAVRPEATTCSAPSPGPCVEPAAGIAEVSGSPATAIATLWTLKLACAAYLPPHLPSGLAGASLEIAFESSLMLSSASAPGDPVSLRLTDGNAVQLLNWAGPRPTGARDFDDRTGMAMLFEDRHVFFLPGVMTGEFVEDNGNTFVLRLREMDIEPLDIQGNQPSVRLRPDLETASAAGWDPGVFGVVEVNYSNVATFSRVVEGAASNDVEVVTTAIQQAERFVRGDCDGDGNVSGLVNDAVFLLRFNFGTGADPICLEACDTDGNGTVRGEVTDAVYVLQYSFLGGPPPPAPFPACDVVHTVGLGCETSTCEP